MGHVFNGNRFYLSMGLIMLGLVILGFGSAAFVRAQNPLEMPLLFHIHGVTYLAWFCLFILQVSIIGKANRALHMKLGAASPIVVAAMLVTGWMMAAASYFRGTSPIPDISIQQFMAFPFFDLVGLIIFYGFALAKRADADFHKRAMLMALVSILDPATARIGLVVGFPPFPLLVSLILIGLVIWHDRRMLERVHIVTWCALVWVFLRLGFVFGFGATDTWATLANQMFG